MTRRLLRTTGTFVPVLRIPPGPAAAAPAASLSDGAPETTEPSGGLTDLIPDSDATAGLGR